MLALLYDHQLINCTYHQGIRQICINREKEVIQSLDSIAISHLSNKKCQGVNNPFCIYELGILFGVYKVASDSLFCCTLPTFRNKKFYTCCDEPYLDITFNITMRRKTLFYTVGYCHNHNHKNHHHYNHHNYRHHQENH